MAKKWNDLKATMSPEARARADHKTEVMLRRTDMHVSTLREIVEGLGGSLEITARFPDREYRIDQLAPAPAG